MVILEIEGDHAGQRLDKFLGKYLSQAPSGFYYKMLRKKNITLNGKRAEGRELLRQGDRVALWLADETLLKFGGYLPGQPKAANGQHGGDGADNISLYRRAYHALQGVGVVYEDSHVLILDKPAGVLTQQAKAGDLSLNEWMVGYLLDAGGTTAQGLRLFCPSVCNRLDRNTSGLVLCGKSLPGSQALGELIRSREVHKLYRTVCVGVPEAAANGVTEIQGYLQKDSRTNQVAICRQGPGEYIRTNYRVLGQYRIPSAPPRREFLFAELEVGLVTGKTHQIRAHLASVGHPLAGDNKYGNAQINQLLKRRFGLRWQLLHAHRLQFPKLDGALAALSGKSIESPLPAQFEAVLRGMEGIG